MIDDGSTPTCLKCECFNCKDYICKECYDKAKSELLKDINKLRDELYNKLPVGDLDAFNLIRIIKCHINRLDEFQQLNSKDKHDNNI